MKQSPPKTNFSFVILGLILLGSLLLPGLSGAMTAMDSSNCPQQVTCNICISAETPVVQGIERNLFHLSLLKSADPSMFTLPTQPASPPPKD